ncbi:MAG TPA: MgtC/SapB family protein [Ktedonobacteraceae bacterium]|nr:MgtC/SapB family protein [Ktedonobacteraceae bacterium]
MISFPQILFRLTIALLLGAVVGFEREQKEHAAGLRTLALVSLGCALFTIISAYGFLELLTIPHTTLDPSRTASYIVAGIGFLGAGTIFLSRQNEKVKGLTTAATIWVIAAVGIACGVGMILAALVTTAMVLVILFLLPIGERAVLPPPSSNLRHLHIRVASISGQLISNIYETCTNNKITIERLTIILVEGEDEIGITCRIPDQETLARVIGNLHSLSGIKAIQANVQTPDA